MDWSRWSVILLKPDCVQRGLVDVILERVGRDVSVVGQMNVTVADWQIFVHYWDLLVNADWFTDREVVSCLRDSYVGQQVTVALAHGSEGADTPTVVRSLLGHFDPSKATPGTLRADYGVDSLELASAQGRLVDNLIHSSDDSVASCRDFGIWYGANRWNLIAPTEVGSA
ncbi:nucleoside-diphosphate kinase [Streptomyces sp. SID13031]|uniref:nucleoside-diphosphate kinase n=1 Tax=Streptomyces sp. SID13031 TaxID=2706046 RepID=UPI00194492AD